MDRPQPWQKRTPCARAKNHEVISLRGEELDDALEDEDDELELEDDALGDEELAISSSSSDMSCQDCPSGSWAPTAPTEKTPPKISTATAGSR